jgi:tripartite ATP-independent transporter DctP family solute receptor
LRKNDYLSDWLNTRQATRRQVLTVGALTSALALFPILEACGQGGTGAAATPGSTSYGPPTYTLRMPIPTATNSVTFKTASYLVDRMLLHTNGAVACQIFPNGQFGGSPQDYANVAAGTFDMGIIDSQVAQADIPAAILFQLPYIYDSRESAQKVYTDPKFNQPVTDGLAAKGIHVLAWASNGIKQMGGQKSFIEPSNLSGVKMRVVSSPLNLAMFGALGAIPVSLSPTETYAALQQGVVQGYDQPLGNIISFKWYEVAKHITMTQHVNAVSFIAINKKLWDSFPPAIQSGMATAGQEAATFNDNAQAASDVTGQAVLTKGGVTFHAADLPAYRTVMQPVYTQFAPKVGGPQVIQNYIAAQK